MTVLRSFHIKFFPIGKTRSWIYLVAEVLFLIVSGISMVSMVSRYLHGCHGNRVSLQIECILQFGCDGNESSPWLLVPGISMFAMVNKQRNLHGFHRMCHGIYEDTGCHGNHNYGNTVSPWLPIYVRERFSRDDPQP